MHQTLQRMLLKIAEMHWCKAHLMVIITQSLLNDSETIILQIEIAQK